MGLRSTIPLIRLNHNLECRHGFIHAPLQYMELDSFIALVLQELIVVLSDSI